MFRQLLNSCGWFALLAAVGPVQAADVRYYQENGVTYRETRYKVQHPVTETVLVDQPRTVYREKIDTQLRDTVHTYQVPVTTYRYEPFILNRWNPFAKPIVAQRQVPVTEMVTRTETVKVPLTTRQIVPETTTVKVAVTRTRIVDEEITSRVAVADPPRAIGVPQSSPATAVAAASPFSSAPPKTPASTPLSSSSTPPLASRSTFGTPPMTALPAATGTNYSVGTASGSSSATPPTASRYGGVSNLSQDPPRTGTNYQWTPSSSSVR
ncbi:MAG TPA: hypothetical protein VHY20_09995 [Pirellulales bacterium]|jgi:hypothetical protein|nr:hypothetical protein [Pirellulales bacterium]